MTNKRSNHQTRHEFWDTIPCILIYT